MLRWCCFACAQCPEATRYELEHLKVDLSSLPGYVPYCSTMSCQKHTCYVRQGAGDWAAISARGLEALSGTAPLPLLGTLAGLCWPHALTISPDELGLHARRFADEDGKGWVGLLHLRIVC